MPSAIVAIFSSAIGRPAGERGGVGRRHLGLTPMTRTSGRCALTAAAMPASKPPPPAETTTVRTSGHCSRISRPQVPWPATMSVVVEGVDEHRPRLVGPGAGGDEAVVDGEPRLLHQGAVRAGGLELGQRRAERL